MRRAKAWLIVNTSRTSRHLPLWPKDGGAVFAAEVAKAKRATAGGSLMQTWTLTVREACGSDVLRVEVESGSVAFVTVARKRRRTVVPADVLLHAMRLGSIATFDGRRSW